MVLEAGRERGREGWKRGRGKGGRRKGRRGRGRGRGERVLVLPHYMYSDRLIHLHHNQPSLTGMLVEQLTQSYVTQGL